MNRTKDKRSGQLLASGPLRVGPEFDRPVESGPGLLAYFTSFQYEAFRRQAKTVKMDRNSSTSTPRRKRWA